MIMLLLVTHFGVSEHAGCKASVTNRDIDPSYYLDEGFSLREFSQVALLLRVTHPYAKIKSSPASRRTPPSA